MNLHPWQQNVFNQIATGGIEPGQMMVISAGRGVGKSMLTQQAIDRLMRDLNSWPVTDLVLSEGRVHGARYYCVEPVGGNWREMEAWAIQTCGEVSSVWRADKWVEEPAQRWYMNDRRFWFRNEADRTMFILKWR
jgi:hypothetical protein